MEGKCRVRGSHLQDLRSACLVLLRSLGVVLVAGVFVAVFTNDSSNSSSPSVRFPLVFSSRSNGPSDVRAEIHISCSLYNFDVEILNLTRKTVESISFVNISLKEFKEL